MTILKPESDEVTSNFRGVCPLCNATANFTVEGGGVYAAPKFTCPNCGATWEYWEDWENPHKMKGAKLVQTDRGEKGTKLLDAYLETSFWQTAIDDKTAIDRFELKSRTQPKSRPKLEALPKLRGRLRPIGFKRLKNLRRLINLKRSKPPPSETVPEEPAAETPPPTAEAPPTEKTSEAPAFKTYSDFGFQIDYPADWVVLKEKRSKTNIGSLALVKPIKPSREVKTLFKRKKTPPRGERFRIGISWGPLAKMKDKYPTLDQFVESAVNGLETRKDVFALDVKDRRTISVCGHEAIFTHLTVEITKYGSVLTKLTEKLEARSIVLYCEDSKRYFAINAQTEPEKSQEQGDAFENALRSFNCHPKP